MKWNVLFGILISAVFVLVIFYQVDFPQLATALQSVNVFPLILAALLLIFTHLIRAWRWRYLLESVKRMPIRPLFSAIAIGFLANMLLPAHAGEVVRAYVIGRQEKVSTLSSLATVVVARVADFVTILLILVFILAVIKMPEEMASAARKLKVLGYISAVACVLFTGGLWLVMAKTVQTVRLLRSSLVFLPARWLDGLIEALTAFAIGLQVLKKGHHLIAISVLSCFLWAVVGLTNMLVLHAFGLQLPWYAAFLILVVQTFGVLIPSAPGFIGTYHAAVIAGLMVFGVVYERALSVALVMHATFFFPFILVGLICLWKESLSLHDLWSVKAQELKRRSV
jgi:uncharacterized protein (TIRG00374 family)